MHSLYTGMLTGMFEASAGDAWVDQLSINEDMEAIRERLGVCPQHSILWPTLTVREHLELFAALKGVPTEQVEMQVDVLVSCLCFKHSV